MAMHIEQQIHCALKGDGLNKIKCTIFVFSSDCNAMHCTLLLYIFVFSKNGIRSKQV